MSVVWPPSGVCCTDNDQRASVQHCRDSPVAARLMGAEAFQELLLGNGARPMAPAPWQGFARTRRGSPAHDCYFSPKRPRADSADAAGAFFASGGGWLRPEAAQTDSPRARRPAWIRRFRTAQSCAMANSGARPLDIGGWLRGLGLGQYEATFRENEIHQSVLPSLTAEDSKELGVVPLGHRRKLLDAFRAGLSGDVPLPALASTPPSTPDGGPYDCPRSRRRAPARHGDILRSRGFDGDRGEA